MGNKSGHRGEAICKSSNGGADHSNGGAHHYYLQGLMVVGFIVMRY